ncbi:hypothetical protein DFP73DRAFT_559286 [Morchella snyderi]|nr:hypothetical protein DFP73DRAFT_559286 [Morchella snyderi]
MQTDSSTQVPNLILNPALKVGAVTGAAGTLFGGAYGIIRNRPTLALFAMLTGVNSAILGGTYWATRMTMIRALQGPETLSLYPREKAYVSGAAGAIAGGFVAFVLGKPRSSLPGALVWGLIGLSGQTVYNVADARHTNSVLKEKEPEQTRAFSFWDRAMRSRWSPVTRLTAEEYEEMLKGKLLALEADLAIADEEIAKLETMRMEQQSKPITSGREPVETTRSFRG